MFIITAVGPDKPGMAHAVAQVLFEAGCNIEDTTMTRLSGEFAMILIVSPPQGVTVEEISGKLAPVEQSHGLFVTCRPVDKAAVAAAQESVRYIVSVYGPEASGLVARITGALADQGANITDVQTRVASGGTVYVMLFEVELPEEAQAPALEEALQAEAHAAGLQVSLRQLEEETL